MNTLRIAGAVLVAFSGVMTAYVFNSGARGTLRRTEAFIGLVRFMRSQIECFVLPLPTILERCPKDTLRSCGYSSDVPPRSLGELLDGCEEVDDEVMREMRRLASELGRGYRAQQLALCDYTLSLLEARRAAASGQLPVKIKVNSALALASAAAVVILLI